MKTFQEFMLIAESTYDASFMSGAQVRKTGEGGRVGTERKKTAPERRRTKRVGGGQTVPAKEYKPRSDIGSQRKAETRVQQPEQERGSARERQLAAAKEERRKAAQARIAAKKGAATTAKLKSKELEKAGTQLISKKKKETVSPDYKPQKASGLSTQERKSLYKKGERTLRDIVLAKTGKKSEKELKHKYTSK